MKISAIPTEYGGVRFRSRLEAKWAALFDLAGWMWDYEPLDLDGYVPDFVLRFRRPILVEVKPFMWTHSEEEAQSIAHARAKVDLSGWAGEAWILGATITSISAGMDNLCGLFREQGAWGTAGVYHCNDCGNKTPFHRDASWMCRICGADEDARARMQPWDAVGDFRAAANRVQWKAA